MGACDEPGTGQLLLHQVVVVWHWKGNEQQGQQLQS
jgi:hypothetical protein